jgi:hypothetical protein
MPIPPSPVEISAAGVRDVLAYDPETGAFTWRLYRGGLAKPSTKAGTKDERGVVNIRLNRRPYKAHRLAWLYVHGEWPELDVDHIDGDPGNNRIANLRLATMTQNLGNMRRHKNNTCGFKGVSLRWDRKAFRARIKVNGTQQHLGCFQTAEEAHAAYMAAAERLFGEFARAE